jgi:hypothetical protein
VLKQETEAPQGAAQELAMAHWVFEWARCPNGTLHVRPPKRLSKYGSAEAGVDAVFSNGRYETDDDDLAGALMTLAPFTRALVKLVSRTGPIVASDDPTPQRKPVTVRMFHIRRRDEPHA